MSPFVLQWLLTLLFGLVEGITEWLPVSSTGHLILLESALHHLGAPTFNERFFSVFLVVIQLGAILAVVLQFWRALWPLSRNPETHQVQCKTAVFSVWLRILLASVPAGVIGTLFGEQFDRWFYRPWIVAVALIAVGIWFLVVETFQSKRQELYEHVATLPWSVVWWIGCFQLLAAVFPGTSRSGATILGALLFGVSRKTATEFTFYLAIPAMAGASLLKLLHAGLQFQTQEWIWLVSGLVAAFLCSWPVVRFLLRYIRTHNFKPFAWYRIALGILVLLALPYLSM